MNNFAICFQINNFDWSNHRPVRGHKADDSLNDSKTSQPDQSFERGGTKVLPSDGIEQFSSASVQKKFLEETKELEEEPMLQSSNFFRGS